MTQNDIDTRLPLALVYSPEGGFLYGKVQDLAARGFQVFHVQELSDLSGFNIHNTKNMSVCVFDLGGPVQDFADYVDHVDINFRDAGGPIVVVGDADVLKDEDSLLSKGAAKVVDVSLGCEALGLVLSLEIGEFNRIRHLKKELLRRSSAIGQIVSGVFKFKTRREAQNLATMLSLTCPNPMPIAVGLAELLINGVEHGCLDIGHDEKGSLIEEGRLLDEIKARRSEKKYAERFVTVDFKREPNRLCFVIKDGGEGFDYQPYVDNREGHEKKHGRGIMMAKGCFEVLEYRGCGNEVYAVHFFG